MRLEQTWHMHTAYHGSVLAASPISFPMIQNDAKLPTSMSTICSKPLKLPMTISCSYYLLAIETAAWTSGIFRDSIHASSLMRHFCLQGLWIL